MKNRVILTLLALVLAGCVSQKKSNSPTTNTSIKASIDLTKVVDDKLPIIINPGIITTKVATYRLPRIVQGTYAISDFGRFIEDFKALDYYGKELTVTKSGINTWVITDAKKLDKIVYLVNDTFDIEKSSVSLIPLSPSGTNIEPKNYILNLHGLIGYFDSLKEARYELSITSPINFKRTSTLRSVNEKFSDDGEEVTSKYIASRYFDITDNPMMYGDLDIENFKVGKMNFELSVYSSNKLHTAKKIKNSLLQMLEAQVAYIGDINSTQNYTIMVYFSDGKDKYTTIGTGLMNWEKIAGDWSPTQYYHEAIVRIELVNVNSGYSGCDVVIDDISFSTSCEPVVGVGIETQSNEMVANIYPNPATNYLQIDLNKNAAITVYNMVGEKVMKNINTDTAGYKMDVSHLPKGIYFIQIQSISAKKTSVLKFIVE